MTVVAGVVVVVVVVVVGGSQSVQQDSQQTSLNALQRVASQKSALFPHLQSME